MSADADPYTGVAVSDSTSPECETSYTEGKTKHVLHWCTLGGTSLASPLIASVFALAGGAGGVSYPASTLYANVAATPKDLHDVTSGSNGACAAAVQRFDGRLRLHRRRRGRGLRQPPDLPRRHRLRRAHGARHARRAGGLRSVRRGRRRRIPLRRNPPARKRPAGGSGTPGGGTGSSGGSPAAPHPATPHGGPVRRRRTRSGRRRAVHARNGDDLRSPAGAGLGGGRRATTGSGSWPSPSPPAPPCTSTSSSPVR